jgi:hypothetical protein
MGGLAVQVGGLWLEWQAVAKHIFVRKKSKDGHTHSGKDSHSYAKGCSAHVPVLVWKSVISKNTITQSDRVLASK